MDSLPRPGWYHAQDDPPGTVRWWDGEQWIGGPTASPSVERPQRSTSVANLFSFAGRVNRTTYFLVGLGGLAAFIAFLLAANLLAVEGTSTALAILAFVVALAWVQLANAVKRFHDMGQSGWLVLLFFIPIPFVGFGVSIWLLAGAGKREENQHGPPPGPGFGL